MAGVESPTRPRGERLRGSAAAIFTATSSMGLVAVDLLTRHLIRLISYTAGKRRRAAAGYCLDK